MEFRQLRTFLAVVAEGTVTDAAIAVELAPSSVSEQVRALERSLGVGLFTRGPDGMRLTAAGERMATWARRLLDQAEDARRDVTGGTSVVRMGSLESLAATRIPAILTRLARRRPETAVEVSLLNRREILTSVATGAVDAGLLLDTGTTLGALGFEAPARLAFLDLEEVPLRYVGAPGTPSRRLLVTPPGCSFRMIADRVLGEDGDRAELGSVTVVRAWARQGLGVALLPEFTVEDELAAGTLVPRPLDCPDVSLRLVWRADREPALRDLLYAASA